jgi:predicted dehydrogenase
VHAPPADPLVLQIDHFCRVIADGETPLVPGGEGLAALKVIEALKTSAREGREVAVG